MSGHIAAGYARDCATNTASPGFIKLSGLMCWDAVMMCALDSGAIDRNKHQSIMPIHFNDFERFVKMSDPIVSDANNMRQVPQGSFLGFFETKDGTTKLIHAMIATGQGCAAGNKNMCIGIGKAVGWEILNI